MNTSYFLAFLPLISLPGFAQISGAVVDEQQQSIPFANVILYQSTDSTFVAGATTAENGQFFIDHQASGTYYLQISSIGYKSMNDLPINLPAAGSTDLGTITLEGETTTLNEVIVNAQKEIVQQTAFGKVVNVQSSLMTQGSNALQVLERLPGVITNRQNNEFSLNGQAGVTVMINGRRIMMSPAELMALLENTLADNIEKVELITSPSSRYDADGGAGIINIVMQQSTAEKSRYGFAVMGGYGFGEKGSASLNYQKNWNKLSFISSYGYVRDVRRSGFAGFGTSSKPAILGGDGSADFSTFNRAFQNGHNLNLTTEYRPTTSVTVGTDWILSYAQDRNLSNNNVAWDTEEFGYLAMRGLSEGNSRRANVIGSVFIDKNWQDNRISLDLSMLSYFNDNPTNIDSDYFDENGEPRPSPSEIFTTGNRGQSLSRIQVGVAKIDFERSFGASVSGEFGGKISFSDNKNDSGIESLINGAWQTDARSQSLILGKEKILAAYGQFRFTLGEKSSLHAGLRYEFWRRDINTEKDPFRISGLFPTLLFVRDIKEGHSFNLGFSRRITRPLYTDLVSNLFYNDPTFIFSGNPALKPTLTDQIKLDYTIPWLSSSLSFQYEKDPILRHQITTNQEQNVGISSPQNLDYSKSLTLFLNAPLQLTSWWKMSISSTTALRSYQISYTPKVAAKTYLFQSFNFSQNFALPGDIELELSGWHNLRSYNGSNRTAGFGIVNLGLAKKLKNDQGSLALSLPDVFRTFQVHTYIGAVTDLAFDIKTESDWWDETALYQVFRLSYSRSFGGKVAQKNRSQEEELKRVNN
uniref:TonB-dependent receptor n=1 Tax=Roseihalotalea indica TaxID=2867963 RepID=A0AA49GRL0_9BACT|nr:TonB-dependent receptor [Tunicatimonas sp. TK19036]